MTHTLRIKEDGEGGAGQGLEEGSQELENFQFRVTVNKFSN